MATPTTRSRTALEYIVFGPNAPASGGQLLHTALAIGGGAVMSPLLIAGAKKVVKMIKKDKSSEDDSKQSSAAGSSDAKRVEYNDNSRDEQSVN